LTGSQGAETESRDTATVELEHHDAELGEITLHYVTAGSGDPVVLLHGWPQTWYEWRLLMPLLGDSYQLIAPDLRGLGDSSRASEGFDKRTLAGDIWRLLHEHLGHESFYVVGHDWGSAVAYALAAAHPEAVRRLALVEAFVPSNFTMQPGVLVAGGQGETWQEACKRSWHMNFHSAPGLPEVLVSGNEREYIGWFLRNYAYREYEFPEEDIDEYARTYSDPAALSAGFGLYRAASQDAADNEELGTTLPMPVLLMQAVGPSRLQPNLPWRGAGEVEGVRWTAPQAEEILIEEAGHWIPEEQPEVLAGHLRTFFAGA
jgi:pimeloyl-ACP methyl ester carboxylesterase